jgi:hypothetical protein
MSTGANLLALSPLFALSTTVLSAKLPRRCHIIYFRRDTAMLTAISVPTWATEVVMEDITETEIRPQPLNRPRRLAAMNRNKAIQIIAVQAAFYLTPL